MSHFLDRLHHFALPKESFADGHGVATGEDRTWEDAYRNRWAHDKIVRSTHGVNCTGSCSWKIYVKGGIVTWETQQTDYPRTRWDMPNHEPRGCARGASYSWYLYSANRVKHPMVRGRLLKHWRAARLRHGPVEAWASIVGDDAKRRDYQQVRGLGGFVRSSWDEVNEIVAAANVYTAKTYGPDRVIGFSPIPAMSMVSYAAGSRYLSLIGGVCMSFYDWYCDLPPASPQVWGEQTDVPESADWFNSTYIIAWGSNVPQTRTPDAHFFTEVRYKGAKTVAVTPDYSEVAKLTDLWLHPKQGTDAALAMAMGHVVLRDFFIDQALVVFRRLCSALHGPADARDAEGARDGERRDDRRPGPLCACVRFQRQARPGQQFRLEDRRLRRKREGRAAERRHRVPLGPRRSRRPGTVESRVEGGAARQRRETQAVGARRRRGLRDDRPRRFSVLRRHRERAFSEQSRCRRSRAHRAGQTHRARQGRREARGARRHRVRPASRKLRRRARTRGRARGDATSTTTRRTRRPGRRRSPACRARRSSRWPGNSPKTRTRRRASRW